MYLLKSLYQSIIITPDIAEEFGQKLPSWFVIQKPKDSKLNVLLNSLIDKGEASAITLALELDQNVLLILDDFKARRIAEDMDIRFTGTLGVLALAKQKGEMQELKPILDSIIDNGFRISPHLRSFILQKVGEAE